MNNDTQNTEPCQEKLYSFKELHKMKIYLVLLEYRDFMGENHLQGYATSTYYVELYHDDELVRSIGIKYNGLNKTYELNRMATKLNV